MMNGDPRVSICLLISILAPWSVNFNLETSSNFDAGEDEGFRWLLHEEYGAWAWRQEARAYGAVDMAVGGVKAEFSCGAREKEP
ncbi:Thimet oligopeptidase [Gossypium arboreum]|uniref:Thimet oligopeptidase n=1 Tax=Gossypium arboreum TaxID=29729 RepID=A0A0B0N0V9_GOSAR|nr:Thimet oligopeptidase [Gossypium arboreum]KHG08098.1 Thimet oligopeptidase [Gossypium arboreum]